MSLTTPKPINLNAPTVSSRTPAPERLWIGTELMTVLIDPKATGNQFALIEVCMPPPDSALGDQGRGGPPLHIHTREDETFHVLEGAMGYEFDGARGVLTPGQSAFLPRNKPHRFFNAHDGMTRFLMIVTPGDLMQFFRDVQTAHASFDLASPPEVTPAVGRRIVEVFTRTYGGQIIG